VFDLESSEVEMCSTRYLENVEKCAYSSSDVGRSYTESYPNLDSSSCTE
jgi:hypothetical protein